MDKNSALSLFEQMHPGFFEKEHIRNIGDSEIFAEMILPLDDISGLPAAETDMEGVVFGRYTGDTETIRAAVNQVEEHWVNFYDDTREIYCALADGKIASFCVIEDMGTHELCGAKVRIGGPGCVGTVPKFRRHGIGLKMIRNVTCILKERGYDISYIHYTGVSDWYAKLNYKTILRWNGFGPIE